MTAAVTPFIWVTCKNTSETSSRYWPLCMDNGENGATIPSVDASQLETACLKLAELPETLPPFKQPREEPQTQTVTPVVLLEAWVKLDQHLDDNVYPAVRVISDTTLTYRLKWSVRPNEPATTSATQRCV